jgi:hypothetical protein
MNSSCALTDDVNVVIQQIDGETSSRQQHTVLARFTSKSRDDRDLVLERPCTPVWIGDHKVLLIEVVNAYHNENENGETPLVEFRYQIVEFTESAVMKDSH